MEASRLAFVLGARTATRLPYNWAAIQLHREGKTLSYRTQRRWPGPAGVGMALRLRIGKPLAPSPVEHFFTARWGLHSRWYGATVYTPVTHEQWPLHTARLLDWADEGLLAAAGLPVAGAPASVLYTSAVHARTGVSVPVQGQFRSD
jgi:uncharacterized protein YqjF (DUF2071 family)